MSFKKKAEKNKNYRDVVNKSSISSKTVITFNLMKKKTKNWK